VGNKKSSNPKWATMAVNRCAKIFPPDEYMGQKFTFLDVGARDGFCTKLLNEKGYDGIGVDVEPTTDYEFLFKQDFKDVTGYFDLVFARHVIEHFDDIDWFLEKCKNIVLGGGGIFLVFPLQDKGHIGSKHQSAIPSIKEFRKHTEKAGFEEVACGKMRKKGRTGKYDEVYYAGIIDS